MGRSPRDTVTGRASSKTACRQQSSLHFNKWINRAKRTHTSMLLDAQNISGGINRKLFAWLPLEKE
jgi:hypothetical protein